MLINLVVKSTRYRSAIGIVGGASRGIQISRVASVTSKIQVIYNWQAYLVSRQLFLPWQVSRNLINRVTGSIDVSIEVFFPLCV